MIMFFNQSFFQCVQSVYFIVQGELLAKYGRSCTKGARRRGDSLVQPCYDDFNAPPRTPIFPPSAFAPIFQSDEEN